MTTDLAWRLEYYKAFYGPESYGQLLELCPAMLQLARCPGQPTECVRTDTVLRIIMHLNDNHLWSREWIADWLDETGLDLSVASS